MHSPPAQIPNLHARRQPPVVSPAQIKVLLFEPQLARTQLVLDDDLARNRVNLTVMEFSRAENMPHLKERRNKIETHFQSVKSASHH